jgi:hypothetical protein
LPGISSLDISPICICLCNTSNANQQNLFFSLSLSDVAFHKKINQKCLVKWQRVVMGKGVGGIPKTEFSSLFFCDFILVEKQIRKKFTPRCTGGILGF